MRAGFLGSPGSPAEKVPCPCWSWAKAGAVEERGQRETELDRRLHWYLQLVVVHRNAHIFIFFIGVPCCRAGSGAGGVTS